MDRGLAQPSPIRVDNQEDFDSLGVRVLRFLDGEGEELEIRFGPGPFRFREGHLELDSIQAPGKTVRLLGDGTRLLPVTEAGPFHPSTCRFVSGKAGLEPVPEVRQMKKARSLVWIVDRKQKICRIRTDAVQDPALIRNGYIFLTQWFRGKYYKITGVKGRYVYFQADDLRQIRLLYSVNLDFTFSFRYPRYSIQDGGAEVCQNAAATSFLSIRQSRLDGISLSGFVFVGNDGRDEDRGVIQVDTSSVSLQVSGCRFEQIHSTCLTASLSQGIRVEDCSFADCYRDCITVGTGSTQVVVSRNHFDSTGMSGDNVACITCYAAEFQIRDNVISDFGYSAIRTGIHYSLKKEYPLKGVISGNEIFQTPAYFAAAPDYLLMDSGAIYLSTQIDDMLVENNHIHDINGPTYNRGIFADDGASNLRIVGNTVSNIRNHFAVDVDPRSAWKMLHRRNRLVSVANEHVVVRDNVVDGKARVAHPRRRRLRN